MFTFRLRIDLILNSIAITFAGLEIIIGVLVGTSFYRYQEAAKIPVPHISLAP